MIGSYEVPHHPENTKVGRSVRENTQTVLWNLLGNRVFGDQE